ncbi:MAG: hypothetical protein LUE61_00705 [Clostridiales bacterium]|nr:hypothetical protein [Clostridiales bacterium]
MHHNTFQAGAGIAPVRLDNGCLPLDGFIGTHDDLHVRVLLLEGTVRFALVSIEITSIFDDTRDRFRDLASRALDTAPDNVWITLTHSFCGPHIWPAPKEGKPHGPGGQRDPETVRRCALLEDAYCAALEEAAGQALAARTEAVVGWGTGRSAVNVSRNLPTEEGWWLGSNPEAPCDHSLHVLRIDRTDGTPLALLYNLGIRPCVTSDIRNPDGTGLISGDISGVTSTSLEQEFGGDFVAMFLCGAAGDQEPVLKANSEAPDHLGQFRKVSLGEDGYALLSALSAALEADVLRVWRRIATYTEPVLRTGQRSCTFQTKAMNRNLGSIRPAKSMTFTPDGEKTLDVYAMTLGSFNLVGVQPETNGATSVQLADAFPGETTALAIMVNGCDKCMPEEEAYRSVQFQCQNSPFMPGSAERLLAAATELLNDMKEGKS